MKWQPRTWAKHSILQEYLKGWFPILTRKGASRLLYVDAFAAEGEYAAGESGSPILAIKTAIEAAPSPERIRFKLADEDPSAVRHLNNLLAELRKANPRLVIDDAVQSKCDVFIASLLTEAKQFRTELGPAFFFLDQFGYSSVPVQLIAQILSNRSCETFTYLNWNQMHPYLTDSDKAPALNRAMGNDSWREVIPLRGHERTERFKALYIKSMKDIARASFVYPFEIRDHDRKLLHWFFFCTNNLKGLEIMNESNVESRPIRSLQFSESDLGQGALFQYSQQNLADDLYRDLIGRSVSKAALEEHVLVNTPHYIFGEAVRILRADKRLLTSGSGDDAVYQFVKPPSRVIENTLFNDF